MNNKKLLLISGQVVISTALEAKFKLSGIDIQVLNVFEDVENLLRKIELIRPAAIIFDLEPRQTQIDLLSAVSGSDIAAKALIFIWSDLDAKTTDKCKKLGADYCLSPLDLTIDEFIVKVKKILKNKNIL